VKAEAAMKTTVPVRLAAVDRHRGLVMIIMALDHSSFFLNKVHPSEFWGIAPPLYPGSLELITRLVTHLCAPGFFLTMGIGMAFWYQRHAQGFAYPDIIRHFGVRALLILVLHQLVENPAWLLSILTSTVPIETFSSDSMPGGGGDPRVVFGVLFSLSIAMFFWALFLRLKTSIVLALSMGAFVLSQYAVPSASEVHTQFGAISRILFLPGQSGVFIVSYPVLPWLGICGIGISIGRALISNQLRSVKLLAISGAALICAFLLGRTLGFGSHYPYHAAAGFQSLVSLAKYPPSINFILLMLGTNLLMLSAFHRWSIPFGRITSILETFGRTPLFFYLVHLWMLSLLGLSFRSGANYGITYLGWLFVVGLLYPMCLHYAGFRNRKPENSVWRAL
jgi:uncharacterized membrane protein